jgi:hypothetical protein
MDDEGSVLSTASVHRDSVRRVRALLREEPALLDLLAGFGINMRDVPSSWNILNADSGVLAGGGLPTMRRFGPKPPRDHPLLKVTFLFGDCVDQCWVEDVNFIKTGDRCKAAFWLAAFEKNTQTLRRIVADVCLITHHKDSDPTKDDAAPLELRFGKDKSKQERTAPRYTWLAADLPAENNPVIKLTKHGEARLGRGMTRTVTIENTSTTARKSGGGAKRKRADADSAAPTPASSRPSSPPRLTSSPSMSSLSDIPAFRPSPETGSTAGPSDPDAGAGGETAPSAFSSSKPPVVHKGQDMRCSILLVVTDVTVAQAPAEGVPAPANDSALMPPPPPPRTTGNFAKLGRRERARQELEEDRSMQLKADSASRNLQEMPSAASSSSSPAPPPRVKKEEGTREAPCTATQWLPFPFMDYEGMPTTRWSKSKSLAWISDPKPCSATLPVVTKLVAYPSMVDPWASMLNRNNPSMAEPLLQLQRSSVLNALQQIGSGDWPGVDDDSVENRGPRDELQVLGFLLARKEPAEAAVIRKGLERVSKLLLASGYRIAEQVLVSIERGEPVFRPPVQHSDEETRKILQKAEYLQWLQGPTPSRGVFAEVHRIFGNGGTWTPPVPDYEFPDVDQFLQDAMENAIGMEERLPPGLPGLFPSHVEEQEPGIDPSVPGAPSCPGSPVGEAVEVDEAPAAKKPRVEDRRSMRAQSALPENAHRAVYDFAAPSSYSRNAREPSQLRSSDPQAFTPKTD